MNQDVATESEKINVNYYESLVEYDNNDIQELYNNNAQQYEYKDEKPEHATDIKKNEIYKIECDQFVIDVQKDINDIVLHSNSEIYELSNENMTMEASECCNIETSDSIINMHNNDANWTKVKNNKVNKLKKKKYESNMRPVVNKNEAKNEAKPS